MPPGPLPVGVSHCQGFSLAISAQQVPMPSTCGNREHPLPSTLVWRQERPPGSVLLCNQPGSLLMCSAFHSEGQGKLYLLTVVLRRRGSMRIWKTVPANEGLDRPCLATRKAKEHRELRGCCVKVVEVGQLNRHHCQSVCCLRTEPGACFSPSAKARNISSEARTVCLLATCHMSPPASMSASAQICNPNIYFCIH